MTPGEVEAYRLHARLPAFARRIAQAKDLLREAAAKGRCALMVSGGKDSLVLAHLAVATLGRVNAFFIDSGAEPPEAHETIAALRKAGYDIETIHPELTIVQMIQMVGGLGYDGPNRLPGDWHWGRDDFRKVLIAEPAARIRARGYPVALVGLRAEESRGRAMRMRRYGPLWTRKDGAMIACPLAWWSGRDIIAYALTHELPLNAIYMRSGVDTVERRRTGTLLGNSGVSHGRWQELRRNSPHVFSELVSMFPEMRNWT